MKQGKKCYNSLIKGNSLNKAEVIKPFQTLSKSYQTVKPLLSPSPVPFYNENQIIKLTKNESEASRTTAITTGIRQEYDKTTTA
jgi:hypothetical protein